MKLVLAALLLPLVLVSCGTAPVSNVRPLTWQSNPSGASVEAVSFREIHSRSSASTQGSSTSFINPVTGQFNFGGYGANTQSQSNTTGKAFHYERVRKVIGYTPFTHSWRHEPNNPADFVKVSKGKDWVVLYINPDASVVNVSFGKKITVTGGRLVDSSR